MADTREGGLFLIPFSICGPDIAQNFVLAHGACNRSKSDILSAKRHVENWLEQITRHRDDISQIALDAGVISDQQTILSVAQWSYQQGHEAGAHAWGRKGEFERIGCFSEFFCGVNMRLNGRSFFEDCQGHLNVCNGFLGLDL